MKNISLENDGKEIKAKFLRHGGTVWIHMNGRTHVVEETQQRQSKKHKLEKNPTQISAPMPGKIIKVMCKAGDKVVSDQTLVVMEAMKMEYALKSTINAQVETLKCEVGQQVQLSELLVSLKQT